MGAVQFEEVEVAAGGPPGGGRELLADGREPGAVERAGVWLTPGRYARGEAATRGQLPSGSGWSMPSHMRRVEPLRPEWPSWTPSAVPGAWVWTKAVILRQAAAWVSDQRPVQPGVIRPSGLTQTISVMTSPAPPRALAPRWTRWKSPGTPSSATYRSIGETRILLRRVSPGAGTA